MSIYNDYSNIKKVTDVLKRYFKDRIKSTYKYRDILKIDTLTFDEYFQLVKMKKLTDKDNLKVRLNDSEIDNLVKYFDYYFDIIVSNKEKKCLDANFLINVLNNVKCHYDYDSKEIKEIYKYLICLDYLKNDLIHEDFTGSFQYKGNEFIRVLDYESKIFIEYNKENSQNYIMDFSPIYFIDKLYVLENGKYSEYCLYDNDLYYLDVIGRGMLSKKFDAVPLKEYLESKGATFLIKDYYKDADEVRRIFSRLKKYNQFCQLNYCLVREWSLKLLSECADKDYTKEQEEMFVNILSSEILKELFTKDSYIFMCDDRIEDSPITDASIESSIPLKEGAISFEVIDNKAIIDRGYKALQKIYY